MKSYEQIDLGVEIYTQLLNQLDNQLLIQLRNQLRIQKDLSRQAV
jgi:hypothetical protein